MRWRVLRTIALLLAIAAPVSARAACTSPAGVPGQMVYNADYATMQFCNGTNWISMAASEGLIELDPHVGTLTPGDFCVANGGGTQVVCTTASIDLASQVSGNLGVSHLNSGTGASSSTFWRGDGTWAAALTALPSLASADIWVGNGSNVATAVALSKDCTLANTGAITCTKTNNVSFAASATTDATNASNISSGNLNVAQLPTLTSTDIWVGNSSNAATARALGGDCTLSNTGAITCTKTNGTSFAASATTDTTNASNITSGTVGTARLGSGTANSTTYLRGDQTWAAPVAGGSGAVLHAIHFYTSGATWTQPANFSYALVQVWGAGGGGGGDTCHDGSAGGTSSFGAYVSANGGGGGLNGNTGGGTPGGGGSTSGGDVNLSGFTGGCTAIAISNYGCGGGGGNDGNHVGGNGGGGGYAMKLVTSTTSTVTVTVGGGGAGGGPCNGSGGGSGIGGVVWVYDYTTQ